MRTLRLHFQSPVSLAVFAVGVLLVVLGSVGMLLDLHPEVGVTGLGLAVDHELEYLGVLTGGVAVLGETVLSPSGVCDTVPGRTPHYLDTVYITTGLHELLVEVAKEEEPSAISAGIAVTPAGKLDGAETLDDSMPVFTDIYLPEQFNSVSSVFGVDLATPPRGIQGRFVSHPHGPFGVTKRDDLHEIVFVAVPPWDDSSLGAFDRAGRRRTVQTVDATPSARSEPVNL